MRSVAVSLGRLEVETADHVVLRYDLAGVGTRGSAALVDGLLSFLMVIGLVVGAAIIGSKLPGALATQLAGVTIFAILVRLIIGELGTYVTGFCASNTRIIKHGERVSKVDDY